MVSRIQVRVPVVFRRRSMAPINSIKHIIDSEGALAAGAQSIVDLAKTVPSLSVPFVPNEVELGAKINAFFLSVFLIGQTGAPVTGSLNWLIWKQRTGQSASSPTPGNTGISQVRNQIIHEEKGLSGSGDGTAMAFKGVIVVPRGMRRMREGDLWKIALLDSTSETVSFCVKAIYKSFS